MDAITNESTSIELATQANQVSCTIQEQVKKLMEDALSARTMHNYRSGWREFARFCNDRQVSALPAEPMTVCSYLAELAAAGNKANTLSVKVCAIRMAHLTAKQPDPTASQEVKLTMKGIRRRIGAKVNHDKPITLDLLKKVVDTFPDDMAGRRNKAMTLIGYAGAFRRSELVSLKVDDLHFEENGTLTITIPRSKTDQEGNGMTKTIPSLGDAQYDPITALREWLDAAGITKGHIFRKVSWNGGVGKDGLDKTGQSISKILKGAMLKLGINSDGYAGHSLRAGFVTSALLNHASIPEVMAQTGQTDPRTTMMYSRATEQMASAAVVGAFGEKS